MFALGLGVALFGLEFPMLSAGEGFTHGFRAAGGEREGRSSTDPPSARLDWAEEMLWRLRCPEVAV
ncbi:MAG: hypothetical protein ACP5E5_10345 [Acidobacteriaceae bacterium]